MIEYGKIIKVENILILCGKICYRNINNDLEKFLLLLSNVKNSSSETVYKNNNLLIFPYWYAPLEFSNIL